MLEPDGPYQTEASTAPEFDARGPNRDRPDGRRRNVCASSYRRHYAGHPSSTNAAVQHVRDDLLDCNRDSLTDGVVTVVVELPNDVICLYWW